MILNKSSVDRGMCHAQIYQVGFLIHFMLFYFISDYGYVWGSVLGA